MNGWKKGKAGHIRLSDAAAKSFNEYGSVNSATAAYMNYELDQISAVAYGMLERAVAVDLGCGEGRIAFHLADLFESVHAFDFSERMIETANRLKRVRSLSNVRCSVRDLEVELLSDFEDESVDLVVGSFGMGSFFQRPERLVQEISRVLNGDGRALLSFYNSESIVTRFDLPDGWHPSLAASINPDAAHSVIVNYGETTHEISANAFTASDIGSLCESTFSECTLTTFPTLSSIIPQSAFSSSGSSEICAAVDFRLADSELCLGSYIVAVLGI